MDGYMFDTNIFNAILDRKIDISQFSSKASYFVTHIQFDELQKTTKDERRNKLIQTFTQVAPKSMPTESFALGISRLGFAKLSDGQLITRLLEHLDSLNRSKDNNEQDVLIAETAITNNLVLVTNDKDLRDTIRAFQGRAVSLQEFLESSS